MSSENLHELRDALSLETQNMHRALVSLIEELEAVDWYQQRAEACTDEALRAVLLHNRREEIEHAMMNLEWIRRNDAAFDANIRTYLGSTGPITEVEASAGTATMSTSTLTLTSTSATDGASLGIGSLRTPAT